jgi:hypothetical protein
MNTFVEVLITVVLSLPVLLIVASACGTVRMLRGLGRWIPQAESKRDYEQLLRHQSRKGGTSANAITEGRRIRVPCL